MASHLERQAFRDQVERKTAALTAARPRFVLDPDGNIEAVKLDSDAFIALLDRASAERDDDAVEPNEMNRLVMAAKAAHSAVERTAAEKTAAWEAIRRANKTHDDAADRWSQAMGRYDAAMAALREHIER